MLARNCAGVLFLMLMLVKAHVAVKSNVAYYSKLLYSILEGQMSTQRSQSIEKDYILALLLSTT